MQFRNAHHKYMGQTIALETFFSLTPELRPTVVLKTMVVLDYYLFSAPVTGKLTVKMQPCPGFDTKSAVPL